MKRLGERFYLLIGLYLLEVLSARSFFMKKVFSAHPYPEDWQPPVMRSNRELKQGRFLAAFVNWKWTFSITGQFFFFFAHIFVKIVYLRITTLSYTNLIASRNNYKRKTSLLVDVRASLKNACA